MSDQNNPNDSPALQAAESTFPQHLSAPKICHNLRCGFQTHEPLFKCPKCGRPMWTTNQFRLISAPLILCGFVLSGIGGGLGYIAYWKYGSGRRIPEGYEYGAIGLTTIAGLVLFFGLVITAIGAWQVIFGKANPRLIYIFLTCLFVMLLILGCGRLILTLLSEM